MMKNEKTWQMLLKEAKNSGIDESDLWLLLEHASGLTRGELRRSFLEPIPTKLEKEVTDEFFRLVTLRKTNRPVQYIIGTQNFMGFDIGVTPACLIPRPETELLAERVIKICKDKSVLDLCTGSGCIAIAIRKLSEAKSVSACDISKEALQLAKENAKKHEADIVFCQGDLFEALYKEREEEKAELRYDIIVSNPPYIPTEDIKKLMPEVRAFEPSLALDGGADGLFFYRRIAAESKGHLMPGGQVFLEIGCEQGAVVSELFMDAGFSNVSVIKDYAGLDRIVLASVH